MRLNAKQLKQIIKEELVRVLREQEEPLSGKPLTHKLQALNTGISLEQAKKEIAAYRNAKNTKYGSGMFKSNSPLKDFFQFLEHQVEIGGNEDQLIKSFLNWIDTRDYLNSPEHPMNRDDHWSNTYKEPAGTSSAPKASSPAVNPSAPAAQPYKPQYTRSLASKVAAL